MAQYKFQDAMTFQIDTDNYLGYDHETYIDNLEAFALTKPSDYMKHRIEVVDKVKKKMARMLYSFYYNLLTEGKDADGDAISSDGAFEAIFKPSLSNQEVTEIALGAVRTLEDINKKALNKILPRDFLAISHNTIKKKVEGDLMN
jgi:hypothetical protein